MILLRLIRGLAGVGATALAMCAAAQTDVGPAKTWRAERLASNPLITPQTDASIGANINGPSLIRVPDWVAHPLGRYYLYFADHNGKYIRLA